MAFVLVSTSSDRSRSGTLNNHSHAELRDLARAVGQRRYVEPRLTGGFEYGRITRSAVSAAGMWSALPFNVQREVAVLESAAQKNDSEALQAAWGVAQLFVGRRDDAVSYIELALMRAPHQADWWSNLAAAYLVRSADSDHPEDVVHALNAARRAVDTRSDLAEARFNLAIALEANALLDAATEAWSRYLDLDSSSPWAAEARERQRAVDAKRVAPSAGKGRTPCSAVADSLWDEAALRIARLLRSVDAAATPALADVESRTTGCAGEPALARDALRDLRRCRQRRTCDALIPAFEDLAAARRHEREDRTDQAHIKFGEAAARLARLSSPVYLVAALGEATAAIRASDAERARRRLLQLAREASRREYHGLAGLAWLEAVNATNGFERLGEVLEFSRRSFDAFRRAGDPVLLASGHNLMSTFLAVVGARQRSWEHRLAALRIHAETPVDADRRLNNLMGAARMATRDELDGAAIAFYEAALHVVDTDATSGGPSQVRIALAQALERLGSNTRAADILADGLAQLNDRVPPILRAALEARLAAAQAALALKGSPTEAIAKVTAALAYHERINDARRLPELLLLRARAHLAVRDTASARVDLLRGVSLVEGGEGASKRGDTSTYFDGVWRLYVELVRLEVLTDNDVRRGLAAAERILLDKQSRERTVTDPATLAAALDPDEVIVRYLCLEDRWLAWVLSADGVTLTQQPVPQATLAYYAKRLTDLMERGTPEAHAQQALGALHRLLFAPMPDRVHRAKRLVIVADGPLGGIPFPALWDSARRRYLVEDYVVSRARGAFEFLAARQQSMRVGQPATRPGPALVIGNPSIDTRWWGGLPPLHFSEVEAREIAALYADAGLLTGQAATPSGVQQLLVGRDVLHFGGHAVESSRTGHASLLLAPDSPEQPESSALSIDALLRATGAIPRLVVLAACRTGKGPHRRASGLTGLPELLLAEGVEMVVASLWDVDDAATQRLMVSFHRGIVEGANAVDALRRAQLELLKSGDDNARRPSAWAAFIAAGNSSATKPRSAAQRID